MAPYKKDLDTRTALRLSAQLREKLDQEAAKHNISVSEVIRDILAEYFDPGTKQW
jgi:predicted HicB family RNase H-like nuclease